MRTMFMAACFAAAMLQAGCGTGPAEDDEDLRTALAVTKPGDDGSEGTLRWAILKSNADPGKFNIVLTPPDGNTLVITPTATLPAIKGPVRIEGPWNGSGTPTVALDGSQLASWAGACGTEARPVVKAGLQMVDSRDVEITGFEVRNFCTGILSLRSHDNLIHKMRLLHNIVAGVVITSDDDSAAGAPAGNSSNNTLERNEFVNNSSGIAITFGAAGTIVRTNTFSIDSTWIGSDAVLIAGSNNAVIEGNRIEGHLIGIQMDGMGHKLTGNVVRANRVGVVQMDGSTNVNTLSENLVYDNGRDMPSQSQIPAINQLPPINLSLNGLSPSVPNDGRTDCSDGLPDCSLPQNTPVLVGSTADATGFVVRGTLASRASATFSIEIFASHGSGIDSRGEGEVFLGRAAVTSDAAGLASFTFTTGTNPLKDGTRSVYFTATATRASNGQTSEFSRPQLVSQP